MSSTEPIHFEERHKSTVATDKSKGERDVEPVEQLEEEEQDLHSPGEISMHENTVLAFSAREILDAYIAAYPTRNISYEVVENDWKITLDGEIFYWADSRLLPENERHRMDDFDAYPFYIYPKGMPDTLPLSDEEFQTLQELLAYRDKNPPKRHPRFYDVLFRARSENEAWERMKSLYFLGRQTTVHWEILENLAGVEQDVLELAKTKSHIRTWVKSISAVQGYNWRVIASTQTRSPHSYGIAIDILEAGNTMHNYWQWSRRFNERWPEIPYEARYYVPPEVVEIFERHGFLWGGKWFYFDNMHFEYRPEMLLLNGFPLPNAYRP